MANYLNMAAWDVRYHKKMEVYFCSKCKKNVGTSHISLMHIKEKHPEEWQKLLDGVSKAKLKRQV